MEGGLVGNTEDDEDPYMDTGFYREVPMPEVNDKDVKIRLCFQEETVMLGERSSDGKDMQIEIPLGGEMTTP